MSGDLLRRALAAFRDAAPGEGLDAVADRLGVGREEAADLAAYWVRKGRLRRTALGASDCTGCFFAARACTGCPTAPAAPALVAFTLIPAGAPQGGQPSGAVRTSSTSRSRAARPSGTGSSG